MKPGSFEALSSSNKNRIRNWFYCGKVRVEYLQLDFDSFNDEYFNAMIDLKAEDEAEQSGQASKRKAPHLMRPKKRRRTS